MSEKMNNTDKKYTKQQLLVFAEMCMKELLSTKNTDSIYSEITNENLLKIKKILNKYE